MQKKNPGGSQTHSFYATVFRGLEPLLRQEISAAGGFEIQEERGVVHFKGRIETAMKLMVCSRVANRLVQVISAGIVKTMDDLYRLAKDISWPEIFEKKHTFAVQSTVLFSSIEHSGFAALRVKDAVADRFTHDTGSRPDVDKDDPDIWIECRIIRNFGSIGINLSGGMLFKRGYHVSANPAGLKETLAAGIASYAIKAMPDFRRFIDPMAGSGTIVLEALMMMMNIQPGSFRKDFAVMRLRNWAQEYKQAFDETRIESSAGRKQSPDRTFVLCDHSPAFLDDARINAEKAGLTGHIEFVRQDFFKPKTDMTNSLIVFNPPYGTRQQAAGDIHEFYARIGDSLKQNCKGSTALIFTQFNDNIKHIGLRPSRKIQIFNSGIECRLLEYRIF